VLCLRQVGFYPFRGRLRPVRSAHYTDYVERRVKPAELKSVKSACSRIDVLEAHLGDLPLEALEDFGSRQEREAAPPDRPYPKNGLRERERSQRGRRTEQAGEARASEPRRMILVAGAVVARWQQMSS